MYLLTLSSILLGGVAILAAGATLLVSMFFRMNWKRRIALVAVVAAAPLALCVVDNRNLWPFLHDLYSIKPGMTAEQVDTIMGGWKKGSGWPASPFATAGAQAQLSGPGLAPRATTNVGGELGLTNSVIYRPDQNSDWGIVEFRDGKVVSVSFSPD